VRAEVKRWWSEDFPDGVTSPDDPEDCCVGIQADIGPVGTDGADTFEFIVCTPKALSRRLDDDPRPFWARGTLIVRTFSWHAAEAAMHQFVRSVSGSDWTEVSMKLNRFLGWEFEDYQA
jgi:hypothetical protein